MASLRNANPHQTKHLSNRLALTATTSRPHRVDPLHLTLKIHPQAHSSGNSTSDYIAMMPPWSHDFTGRPYQKDKTTDDVDHNMAGDTTSSYFTAMMDWLDSPAGSLPQSNTLRIQMVAYCFTRRCHHTMMLTPILLLLPTTRTQMTMTTVSSPQYSMGLTAPPRIRIPQFLNHFRDFDF